MCFVAIGGVFYIGLYSGALSLVHLLAAALDRLVEFLSILMGH